MKKKILIIGAVLLALVVLTIWAVPTFAADPGPATSGTLTAGKVRILARL